MYAIGCDVGSQSLKGTLLDPSGAVVAQAAASYDVEYPHPGWAQQDVRDWRAALASVVGDLLEHGARRAVGRRRPSGSPRRSTVSSPSTPTPSRCTRPSSGSIGGPHRRPIAIDGVSSPPTIRRITGLNLDASHVAPKILWLRDAHPDVFERAAGLLLPGSALVAWLTGERVLDHANASSTLLYDVTTRAWSPRMLDATSLDADRLGSIEAAADRRRRHSGRAAADGHRPDAVDAGRRRDGRRAWRQPRGRRDPARHRHRYHRHGRARRASPRPTPVIDETGLVETHGHADPRVWLVENPGFVSGGSVALVPGPVRRRGHRRGPRRRGGRRHRARLRRRHVPADAVRRDRAALERPGPRRLRRPVPQPRPRPPVPGACSRAARSRSGTSSIGSTRWASAPTRSASSVAARAARLWLQMKADVTGRTVRVLHARRVDGAGRRDAGRRRRRDLRAISTRRSTRLADARPGRLRAGPGDDDRL